MMMVLLPDPATAPPKPSTRSTILRNINSINWGNVTEINEQQIEEERRGGKLGRWKNGRQRDGKLRSNDIKLGRGEQV